MSMIFMVSHLVFLSLFTAVGGSHLRAHPIYIQGKPVSRQMGHRHFNFADKNNLHQLLVDGDATFLHIPMTVGESLEQEWRLAGQPTAKEILSETGVFGYKCAVRNNVSSWHLTPDQVQRCMGLRNPRASPYHGKTIYCIIRDPVHRLLAELQWRRTVCKDYHNSHQRDKIRRDTPSMECVTPDLWDFGHFGRSQARKEPDLEEEAMTFANAVAFYFSRFERGDVGSPSRPLTENLVRLQPQAWYIENDSGERTCQMILSLPPSQDLADRPHISQDLYQKLQVLLQEVYEQDFAIHSAVAGYAPRVGQHGRSMQAPTPRRTSGDQSRGDVQGQTG